MKTAREKTDNRKSGPRGSAVAAASRTPLPGVAPLQQDRLTDRIATSPAMVAQRKAIDRMTSAAEPVQRQPEEEELLQGDFVAQRQEEEEDLQG